MASSSFRFAFIETEAEAMVKGHVLGWRMKR